MEILSYLASVKRSHQFIKNLMVVETFRFTTMAKLFVVFYILQYSIFSIIDPNKTSFNEVVENSDLCRAV